MRGVKVVLIGLFLAAVMGGFVLPVTGSAGSTQTAIACNTGVTAAAIGAQAATKVETIVYITKTGEKYHRGDCRYLKKSKIEITLKDAKKKGYEPCKVCKPPTK